MNIKIVTLTMAAASVMLASAPANAWFNDHRGNYQQIKQQQIKQQQLKKKQIKQQIQKQKVQQRQWQRGNYIPVQYRAPRYVVNDWRAYRLSAPARGHEWRRIDGRYVQVSRHNHQIYQVW